MIKTDLDKIAEHSQALREMGCAVVIFIPEELRGADPDHVEDRLCQLGWDVIDSLAIEPHEGEF
jgi:hypothetical protein